MQATTLLAISILIQFLAAYMAMRLIPVTGARRAWVLISAALVLMAVRRCITLVRFATGLLPEPPDLSSEWVSLFISLLMLGGIKGIAPLFLALKKMAEELRESEAKFRSLADTTPAAILIYQDEKFRYVNPATAAISGCTTEEILHMDYCDIVHPEYRAIMKPWHGKSVRGDTFPCRYELKVMAKTGEEKWVDLAATTIEFDGRPARLATAIDITERKLAEKTLRESEAKYRELVQNANSIILKLNPMGAITFINEFAQSFFGYREEELIGRSALGTIIPERDTSGHDMATLIDDILQNPDRYRNNENENMKKNGERVRISWTNKAFLDRNGNAIEILCIGNDVTELRSLEEQYRQSQKLETIGRLAGGVAHDFNNLLSVIMGYAELTLADLGSDHRCRENLSAIRDAGLRAESLTRQLLAFSRRQILEPRVLNLNSVTAQMEKMLRRLIGEDIDLVTLLPPDLACVKADPGQIEQVIMNLAVNARDAMPQGGKLTIETANVELGNAYARQHVSVTPGPYVMLAVSDTGAGMDSETLSRIFEPFFTTKKVGKGTGLGLATVYGIVKQSGGNIWVYSELGRGTTFKVYLPRHDVEQIPQDSLPSESPSAPLPMGFETILLVEDEELVRSMLLQTLKGRGYTVLEAAGGDEAVRVCNLYTGSVDLLLTDVVMPGMSGRELAEHLKSMRPSMRVIFMSGYTGNAIVHHGILDSGMAFLQKPFTPEALTRKIRRVLGESR